MTSLLRRSAPLLLALLIVPLASTAHAQAATAGTPTNYWFTAGAGWGYAAESGDLLGQNSFALTGAATVQRGMFVASARTVRTSPGDAAVWDAGVLVGLGSSTRYRMRGSAGLGLGRIMGPGASAWTLPVEVQLAWRLRPGVALAAYGFGSFTAPSEFLGATLAVQLGHF